MTNNKTVIRHSTGKRTRDDGSTAIARCGNQTDIAQVIMGGVPAQVAKQMGDTRTGISLGGSVRAGGAAQGETRGADAMVFNETDPT